MNRKITLFILMIWTLILVICDRRKHLSPGPEKHLLYENYIPYAGISHHSWNLRAMAIEAHLSNRTLCVPPFRLAHHHNNDKKITSHMSEYFDYSHVTVDGKKIKITTEPPSRFWRLSSKHFFHNKMLLTRKEDVIVKNLIFAHYVLLDVLSPLYAHFATHKVTLPLHPDLVKLKKEAAQSIIALNSVWIHVRSGDKKQKTRKYTSPNAIRNKIKEIAPETSLIYIATDEKNLSLFDSLKKDYEVLFYSDIPVLKNLKEEDNYKLFLVEHALKSHFTKRIETFFTDSPNCDGFLCPLSKHL